MEKPTPFKNIPIGSYFRYESENVIGGVLRKIYPTKDTVNPYIVYEAILLYYFQFFTRNYIDSEYLVILETIPEGEFCKINCLR